MATVIFNTTPISEKGTTYEDGSFSLILEVMRIHTREKHEVSSIQEASELFKKYITERTEEGDPVKCSVFWPRQNARKFRGYDAAVSRGVLKDVNLNLDKLD